MNTTLSVLIVASIAVSGCATVRESRVNPFNWFGGSSSEPVAQATGSGGANPLIPEKRGSFFRPDDTEEVYPGWPVGTIDELLIERRPGGAIIRVTGIADRAGPFDVRLTEDAAQSGPSTLAYTLRALQSAGPRNAGVNARKVTAALWLTEQELAGIQEIRVTGASNALVTRR
ncbi:hypothetical protein AL036_16950 [Salipiger aestuarii]|uniref:hypothetical protein n=1 Tax=Salipiger aestuarii TaxID=568098 RepID=UPI001239D3BB|nr:hypothetical protein [Salipiger aestuarii]KAA8605871.1 hypothetical protein AL036_16950 [Salipiger aestuarii]KAA8608632.1 hypothetical protein AL037_16695 [Salipiger aestuarii]